MNLGQIFFTSCAAALVLQTASAQNPRASQLVSSAVGDAEGIAIACEDDCSAILWKDSADDTNWVTVSDGTGKSWSPSVRIDDSAGGNKFNRHDSIVISNRVIYSAWQDERLSTDDDVYFTYSKDKAATWSADLLIDKGLPSGANPVRDFALDASGNLVAILMATENSSTGNEELYLSCSTDCGITFSPAIAPTLHNGGTVDIDEIDMEIDGNLIHMAWRDNFLAAPNDDVFYSCYDCNTGTFITQDALVSANANALGGDADNQVELSALRGAVGITFLIDDINGTPEEVWMNVSNDCGVTWCGDQQVGSYTLGVDDCDNPWVLMNNYQGCPTMVLAWEDNRTGSDEVWYASYDLTTLCPTPVSEGMLSIAGGGFPRIAGESNYVAITWSEGSSPNTSGAACSRDAGRNFGPGFIASDTTGDADFSEIAYCSRYCNFVTAWLSDDSGGNDAYAGGFRHPTVTTDDVFTTGNLVNFDVQGFSKEDDGKKFAVLVSASLGNYLVPDGRTTCLTLDNFLAQTIALATVCSPIVTGTIAPDGTGSTALTPLPLIPPGTKLYFIALTFIPSSPPLICCMTDPNCVITS